jgi:putative transposase
MPRAPRLQEAGGFYHVTSRGALRAPIFVDDDDRSTFVCFLEKAVRRSTWRCHAYCLMPNHYHLLLETPQPTLSKGMHYLNLLYARTFNERHGRTGHLFEARFWSAPIDGGDEHFAGVCLYILHNPVRAGLCNLVTEWPWCGGEMLRRLTAN